MKIVLTDDVELRDDGTPKWPTRVTGRGHTIRLHDARHTYATWMLEQGISPKVVQTMLRHSSISVTLDIYSHVSLELETQAAAKLNAVLTGGK